MLTCACGKIFKDSKLSLPHKAKCSLYKEEKSKYLESIRDVILQLHTTESILSIISTLEPNEYVSHSSVSKKLKEWGVVTRTISQSKLLDSTKRKTAETNIARYGGNGNPLSAGSTLLEKRNITNLNRYGVTNIFESEWFKTNITFNDSFWQENYGKSRKDLLRRYALDTWKSYSDSQKTERCVNANLIANSTCQLRHGMSLNEYRSIVNKLAWDRLSSDERRIRTANYCNYECTTSKLEDNVLTILETLYPITRQKWIRNSTYARSFDAHIVGTNILLEINGDYWHGNPKIYNSGDIISYPGGNIVVDVLWERDKNKRELAESFGYRVITIWEQSITQTNDIRQLLINEIGVL